VDKPQMMSEDGCTEIMLWKDAREAKDGGAIFRWGSPDGGFGIVTALYDGTLEIDTVGSPVVPPELAQVLSGEGPPTPPFEIDEVVFYKPPLIRGAQGNGVLLITAQVQVKGFDGYGPDGHTAIINMESPGCRSWVETKYLTRENEGKDPRLSPQKAAS